MLVKKMAAMYFQNMFLKYPLKILFSADYLLNFAQIIKRIVFYVPIEIKDLVQYVKKDLSKDLEFV